MSLFAELKRRNVFRVGIAYIVASWLILQLTEVLTELMQVESDIGKIVIILLIVGFIPALIFAWAFELTPEGIKREREVERSQSITAQTGRKLNNTILVLMALAIAYLLFDKFAGSVPETAQVAQTPVLQGEPRSDPVTEPGIPRQSIAVLPFDNRSQLEEDEFFVEGVHDDLLTNLARIGSLKVISRTSVNLYKDSAKSIPQIAQELGVATVMEGAVQRSGETVRINVQLIDAQTDEHLWAEIFDRTLTAENLFAIQSEIAQRIASSLEATLTDAERDRIDTMPTDSLNAYEAYVRARQLMATRESAKLEEAAGEFRRAVELDPNFALAWVGLADSTMLWWTYGILPREEALQIRDEAIRRALEIDDQLGEAYVSLGQLHDDREELEAAEAAFRHGLELSPNYATGYHWYAIHVGRFPLRVQERVDLVRQAAELDPRSLIIGVNLAAAYENQGLYSRAERQYLKVLELEPGFVNAMANLADLYDAMGRLDQALKYYRLAAEHDPGNPDSLQGQAFVYLKIGEVERAEELLQRMEAMDPERIGNGFVAIFSNMVRGNRAAAREAMAWTLPRVRQANLPLNFFAWQEAIDGNYPRALELLLASDEGWMDPKRWQGLVEQHQADGCLAAWLLLRDGQQELGDQLLQLTTNYLTQDLPAVMEHADAFSPELCHLTAGDKEAAYAVIETQLDHRHLSFWREWGEVPMFDLIRDEPRFQDLMQEYDRLMAEQRALVAKLDEGTAL